MSEIKVELRNRMLENGAERPCGAWNPENLHWLLQRSDLKMKDLAEATGIKESSLKMYQSGYSRPGLEAIIKIADYFRVPVDFLIGRCTEGENGEIFEHFSEYFCDLRDAAYDVYLLNKYEKDDTQRTKYVSTWPFNLVENVYRIEGKNECIEFEMDGLEAAIRTLMPREIEAIRLRYEQEMTLQDCGNECGVSPERFRQILAKAVRKLRHPSRLRLIQYGNLGMEKKKELAEKEAELSKRELALDEREERLRKREEDAGVPAEPQEEKPERTGLDREIEEFDFSVRSYNCLKRAMCRTMRDVAKVAEEGELLKIRNLGRRSAEEVLWVLRDKFGLDYRDKYDFAA